MQPFPRCQTHSLAQKRVFFNLVRFTPGVRGFELASMDTRSSSLSRLPFRWFLIQVSVAAHAQQGVEILHRQKDAQEDDIAVQRVSHHHLRAIIALCQRSHLFSPNLTVRGLCRDPPDILRHTPGNTFASFSGSAGSRLTVNAAQCSHELNDVARNK